jgi:diacylglycerol kinase (ATP)
LIANPVSGRGRGRAVAEKVRTTLAAAGCRVDVRYTAKPDQATELAASAAAAGFERVVAVGGDGTIGDVGAGLAGTGVPLGIVPAGTGNDLCRCLGIPRSLPGAAQLLLAGQPRRIDLWRANDRSFLNAAGIGLDAEVAYHANRGGRLRGMPAYLVALVRALRSFRPLPLRIEGDGEQFSGPVMLSALANATCYGGGIPIAPEARPDDGLLDVVIVRAMPLHTLALQFPRLLRGAHLTHPLVSTFRAASLRIEGDPAARISLDGELRTHLPLAVSLHPAPLLVITGP